MNGKEFLKSTLQSFFIVTTFINIALYVLGSFFQPDFQLRYTAFLYPIFYGACSMIPAAVMYSRKEMTVRKLLIRKFIQMLSIIILLNLFIFGLDGICAANVEKIAGVSASVIIIYMLEEAVSWFIDNRTAAKLTDELLAFQSLHSQEQQY